MLMVGVLFCAHFMLEVCQYNLNRDLHNYHDCQRMHTHTHTHTHTRTHTHTHTHTQTEREREERERDSVKDLKFIMGKVVSLFHSI